MSVSAVIPGGKRKERILENIPATDLNLSPAELKTINDILNNN
ncbi:hypothetical protein GCM10010969_19050 [Saccharibacillus kuerlensis]|uniref:Uncharacterized protein n=1 Tax=Saccharibacillus kuerlensis TaxID=459527 RepID=A0ABQ2L107_9BACL|nr:hypothetical protein GCM10010969_19050 [Saccharibacillus kuerlensis]